jgi:hypothetical protein
VLALAEPDSDVGDVLRAGDVQHRIVRPQDVAGIRAALVELAAEARTHGRALDPARTAVAEFTRAEMARRLAGHLDILVGARRLQTLSEAARA